VWSSKGGAKGHIGQKQTLEESVCECIRIAWKCEKFSDDKSSWRPRRLERRVWGEGEKKVEKAAFFMQRFNYQPDRR